MRRSEMSRIGGARPGHAPTVDNNANVGAGIPQGAVTPGLLQRGPNTTWVNGVVKKDESTKPARASLSEETGRMGNSEARQQHAKAMKEAKDAMPAPPVQTINVEPSQASGDNSSSVEEVVVQDMQKATEGEAKHN